MEYTLGLALEDFVPVVFTAIGVYLLARMACAMYASTWPLVAAGAVLVVLGGLGKASWKLIIATTGRDIALLDNALFWLLGAGFVMLAWGVLAAQRRMDDRPTPGALWLWLVPLVVIALHYGGAFATLDAGRTSFFILLGLTTIGNFVLLGLVIAQGRKQGQWLAVGLFVVNIASIFVLQGLARLPEQTIALQWTEQLVNTVGTACFAFASYRLANETVRRLALPSIAAMPAAA